MTGIFGIVRRKMTDLFEECCPHCRRPYETTSPPGFAEFWSDVPHKLSKAQAEKAWRKLSPADRIAAHGKVRDFYAHFAKTYPTASPLHPATYLNNRRWEDLTEQAAPQMQNDALQYWAGIVNGTCDIPRYMRPSEKTLRDLLEAGLVTVEKIRDRGLA
jgi:hypothetical protein